MGAQLPWGGSGGAGCQDEPLGPAGDDRFTALLRSALSAHVDGPVDVGGLLDGARTRARRIRRRRQVARGGLVAVVAVAVVAVTVPVLLVGTGWPGGGGDGVEAVVAGGPNGPRSASDGGRSPEPTAGTGPTAPEIEVRGGTAVPAASISLPGGTQVTGSAAAVPPQAATGRYVVGDEAVLQVSDITFAQVQRTDDQLVAEGGGPTVTPVCRKRPAARARVAGGRALGYAGSGDDAWVVRTVVRVLPGAAAADELDWLRQSMGTCVSDLRLRPEAGTGVPGDDVVLGYQVGAGQRSKAVFVVGVVRQGRVTVAVELVVPADAATGMSARVRLGLDRTRHLLALADRRLESSGLVAQAQADPVLSPVGPGAD
jgi:hypothetical protein